MSLIAEFCDDIIKEIKEKVPDLASVGWYDGLFDEEDVKEWLVEVPAAYVSVSSMPNSHAHQTGEMNACLRAIVTVVTEDQYDVREADRKNWDLMEKIADVANSNRFGNLNAAISETPTLKRLRDPQLRRDGVALGVVEWDSGFTFGRNKTNEHEYVYHVDTGERIVNMPTMNSFLGYGSVTLPDGRNAHEEVSLRRPDDASPYLREEE